MKSWFIYIVRCANNSLYTGITTDVDRRVHEHQNTSKGAKYLKGKGPIELVWTTQADNRSQASQIEYQIKRLSKSDKERLIKGETVL